MMSVRYNGFIQHTRYKCEQFRDKTNIMVSTQINMHSTRTLIGADTFRLSGVEV